MARRREWLNKAISILRTTLILRSLSTDDLSLAAAGHPPILAALRPHRDALHTLIHAEWWGGYARVPT
jgi:hypothetical protein